MNLKKNVLSGVFLVLVSMTCYAETKVHIVEEGENALYIANLYEMTLEDLIELNPKWVDFVGNNLDLIYTGTKLRVVNYEKKVSKKDDQQLVEKVSQPLDIKGKHLELHKNISFKKQLLDWCSVNKINCIWESEFDFILASHVFYSSKLESKIFEDLARDLYLNNSKIKIKHYRSNDVFQVYSD